MSLPFTKIAPRVVDEPEIVGFERPASLGRRLLRGATAAIAGICLAAGLIALGAVVTLLVALFLLAFAVMALLGGRGRIIVRRG